MQQFTWSGTNTLITVGTDEMRLLGWTMTTVQFLVLNIQWSSAIKEKGVAEHVGGCQEITWHAKVSIDPTIPCSYKQKKNILLCHVFPSTLYIAHCMKLYGVLRNLYIKKVRHLYHPH